jgi:hypothetical protein
MGGDASGGVARRYSAAGSIATRCNCWIVSNLALPSLASSLRCSPTRPRRMHRLNRQLIRPARWTKRFINVLSSEISQLARTVWARQNFAVRGPRGDDHIRIGLLTAFLTLIIFRAMFTRNTLSAELSQSASINRQGMIMGLDQSLVTSSLRS